MKANRFLTLVILCLLLVPCAHAEFYNASHDIKIRKGRSLKYAAIGTIKKGEPVDVYEINAGWGRISFKDRDAYIPVKHLEAIAEEVPPAPVAEEATEGSQINTTTVLSIAFLLLVIYILRQADVFYHIGRALRIVKKRDAGNNDAAEDLPLLWYQCNNCRAVVKKQTPPNTKGCEKAKIHYWINLAEVGKESYYCSACGIGVKTRSVPVTVGCINSTEHSWKKLS